MKKINSYFCDRTSIGEEFHIQFRLFSPRKCWLNKNQIQEQPNLSPLTHTERKLSSCSEYAVNMWLQDMDSFLFKGFLTMKTKETRAHG